MASREQRPRQTSGFDDEDCLCMIEILAGVDPVPDTSALGLDRNTLLAMLAEINKGERSELLPHIARVARQRGLTTQQIAARAGFVLAGLDELGSADYYKILGVSATAPPQEIRDAWIGRMNIYHPDRHPERSDYFTRHAARLNEAYQTLKDPARRQAYDERRRREAVEQQQHGPSVIRLAPGPPRGPSRIAVHVRRRLPIIITAGSVVAAGVVVLYLFLTRPSGSPEARLFAPAGAPERVAVAPPSAAPGADDLRAIEPPPPQTERPSPFQPRDVQRISGPPRQRTTLAQALPPVTPEPKSLDRNEIDALLDEYVDAYEKGDLERLMANLSPRVRERGTLDYQAIRNIYSKGFVGREQIIYRVKNVQVQLKGDTATVTAQYLISARNAAQPQKPVMVSGQIEWKIQREGEKLKIVAINY